MTDEQRKLLNAIYMDCGENFEFLNIISTNEDDQILIVEDYFKENPEAAICDFYVEVTEDNFNSIGISKYKQRLKEIKAQLEGKTARNIPAELVTYITGLSTLFYESDLRGQTYSFLKENDGAEEALSTFLLNRDEYNILSYLVDHDYLYYVFEDGSSDFYKLNTVIYKRLYRVSRGKSPSIKSFNPTLEATY